MKQTRILMNMPITLEIVDKTAKKQDFHEVYQYFSYIEQKFSIFRKDSEISLINQGKISKENYSQDMQMIFNLAQEANIETKGYFEIFRNGKYNPSGLVKGWAIFQAANILKNKDFKNFYIEAGGDIQMYGHNQQRENWRIGIRNPFNNHEIVKILSVTNKGVATSGTYVRGKHIYNPKNNNLPATEIASMTIIGPNIFEADKFATAAFAMGKRGITFMKKMPGFEAYAIDNNGLSTYTSKLNNYLLKS